VERRRITHGDCDPQREANHSPLPPGSPLDLAVRVQAPLNMGILSHRESRVARFDTARKAIVL